MQFITTRGAGQPVSAARAICLGLAGDGGLFVPEQFPSVDLHQALAQPDYPALAAFILEQFLTDYDPAFLRQTVRQVYGEAFGEGTAPLHKAGDGMYSLELWHGPTCAFKDFALQLMPRLLVEAKRMLGDSSTTAILVATSGDTGKAALAGYCDVPGVTITVFYPSHGTSEVQRLQMTTQQGENVAVYAVQGNFDDAQTGVKRVFSDPDVAKQLAAKGVQLSSANSINWGRLVPQIVYYFHAYSQLVRSGALKAGEKADFCVPTGNFGDILAGWYAKQMGLPVGKLICASNKNDVLTEFFVTGVYNARRPFYRTTSPSMDILVSSNLERLLYHMAGAEKVKGWMKQLFETGSYEVEPEVMERIRADFGAACADDETAAAQIRSLFEAQGYLCDPHTAVAFSAARRSKSDAPMVVLSTASPFKFPKDVLAALGQPLPEDEFEAMAALAQYAGQPAPQALACLRSLPERFSTTIRPDALRDVVLGE